MAEVLRPEGAALFWLFVNRFYFLSLIHQSQTSIYHHPFRTYVISNHAIEQFSGQNQIFLQKELKCDCVVTGKCYNIISKLFWFTWKMLERSKCMKGKGRSRALKRRPFNAKKRFLALLMAMVMTFSNLGTNVNVAYADSAERVVFSMRGTDLVAAVEEAIVNGSIVTSESLDFTNGKIEKFEALFFAEGKIYEIYPEYSGGGMDADLRLFVRLPEDADDMYMVTGDEEIIFLYINNGRESISCSTEITRMVDGNEKTKRTSNVTVKSYEAAFGDEEVNIVTKPVETLPGDATVPPTDETDGPGAVESTSPTEALPEESTEPESTASPDTEATEPVETPSGESTQEETTAAETAPSTEEQATAGTETETPAETEIITEAETKGETEPETEAANEPEVSEPEVQDVPEPAKEVQPEANVTAAITRHFAPVVAEPAEGEAAEEPVSAEPEKEVAAEAKEPEAMPPEEKQESSAEETAQEVESTEETTVPETAPETSPETPATEPSRSPDESTDGTGEVTTEAGESSTEVTDGSDSQVEIVDPSTSEETTTSAETAASTEATAAANTQANPPAEQTAEAATKSDLVGIGYCSTAKAYTTTINQLKALDDFDGYKITYTINPSASARIVDGPRGVEEGTSLVFGVKNQLGFAVEFVTANDEILTADSTQNNDDGSLTMWYSVPDIYEEQDIQVYMIETGEHPAFDASLQMEDGTVIHIHADEEVLPAGVTAVASVVTGIEGVVKENVEADAAASGEQKEVVTALSYNIDLMLGSQKLDDQIWSGSVQVTFTGAPIEQMSKKADSVEIMYVATAKEEEAQAEIAAADVLAVEPVADPVDVSGDASVAAVAFDAEHFSVYTVVFSYKENETKPFKIHMVNTQGEDIGENVGTHSKPVTYEFTSGKAESVETIAESISQLDGYEFAGAYVKTGSIWGEHRENIKSLKVDKIRFSNRWTLFYSTDEVTQEDKNRSFNHDKDQCDKYDWKEVNCENIYFSWKTVQSGSLTITKAAGVENGVKTDLTGQTFYFTVQNTFDHKYYDADGRAHSDKKNAVISIQWGEGNNSRTIANLPEGLYKVNEVADRKGTEIDRYFRYTVVASEGRQRCSDDGIKIESGKNKDITFTNTQKSVKYSKTLEARKVFEGGKLKANQFIFVIKNSQDQVVGSAKNDASGKIKFSNLVFREYDGIRTGDSFKYTYTMSEVIPDNPDPNIEYSKQVYNVTVRMSVDLNGNLKIQSVNIEESVNVLGDWCGGGGKPESKIEFVNRYKNNGSINIIKKAGNNETDLDGKTFYFTVTKGREYYDVNGTPSNQKQVIKLDYGQDNNSVQVKNLKNGIYTVSEVKAKGERVDSWFPYTVTKNDVCVTVSGKNEDVIIFNTQKMLTFSAKAQKKVVDENGRPARMDQFTFDLIDGKTGETVATAHNNVKTGEIVFNDVKMPFDGTSNPHKYFIKEVVPEDGDKLPGYTYDTETKIYLTVTPKKDIWNGEIYANVSYDQRNRTFTNQYQLQTCDITIEGKKKVTGYDSDDWHNNGFEFAITEVEKNGTGGWSGYKEKPNGHSEEVTNTGSSFSFNLTYDQNDIEGSPYYYRITELTGHKPFVYDDSQYIVKVNVRDNGDGTIKADQTITKLNGRICGEIPATDIVFVNEYKTGSLKIIKSSGDDCTNLIGETFYFTVTKDGKYYDRKGNASDDVKVMRLDYGLTRNSLFIERLAPGEYTVTEVADSQGTAIDANFKYSVSKNGSTVRIDGGKCSDLTITNTRKTATVVIRAQKKVEGNGSYLSAGLFRFVLTEKNDLFLPKTFVESNAESGDITFNIPVEYDGETTRFEYELKEFIPAIQVPGYTYDRSTYKVLVDVTPGEGKTLGYEVTYPEDKAPVFVNTYKMNDGNIVIWGRKTVSNVGLSQSQWHNGWFTFDLQEMERINGGYTEKAQGYTDSTNNYGYTFAFKLSYKQEDVGKTFYYKVTERQGDESFKYDDTAYIATVSVQRVGAQIVPKLTKVEKMNGQMGNGKSIWPIGPKTIAFNNLYQAGELTIEKKAGPDTDLTGKEFYFTVEKGGKYFDLQGNAHEAAKNAIIEVTCNTEDGGSVTIPKLEKGTYTVTEVAGRDGSLINADSYPYIVSNNGTDVTVSGEQNAKATIENTQRYVTFAPTAVKEVEGRQGEIETFEFGLFDGDNLVAGTKTENMPDGRIQFDDIKIPYNGVTETFRYTMKEIIPADPADRKPGYEYDGTEIPVTVTITAWDGQEPDVSVVYGESDHVLAIPKFVNHYTTGGTFIIEGVKEVTGTSSTDWYNQWFDFRLEEVTINDTDGTYIPVEDGTVLTVKNDQTEFSFELVYNQEDAKKREFVYLLTEDAGARSFTYDKSAYLIWVYVNDNGNGTLEVTNEWKKILDKNGLSYEGEQEEAILFSNAYKSTDNPSPGPDTGRSSSSSSSGNGSRRYTSAAVTIDPGAVPLAEIPDVELIDDGEIPLAALPKTGDETSWVTLNIMLSGALLILIALRKKRKDAE